jgi:gliding motility-associated lipoprotein GldH
MKNAIFAVLLCLGMVLSSCNSGLIYQAEKEIPVSAWAFQDSVLFNFEISDTVNAYSFWLDIKHSTEYAFENLYLKVTTGFPNGKAISDIMPIQFSDEMGKWIGNCSTENCELPILMQEQFFFQDPGKYTLTFQQYSRKDTLQGISKLKVRILELD